MLYLLSWTTVILMLALWTLTAWALHAISVWTVSNAGTFSEVTAGVGVFRLPDWLAHWVPTELAGSMVTLLSGLGSLVQSLLKFAPELTGPLTTAIWIIWGIGSFMLLFLGAGLHLLITILLRRNEKSWPDNRPRFRSLPRRHA